MSTRRRTGMHTLGEQMKEQLVRSVVEAREQGSAAAAADEAAAPRPHPVPEAYWKLDQHPGYLQVQLIREGARRLDIADPFFKVHDGIAGSLTQIGGRPYVNFSSYNYLGLNGDPRVSDAAKQAIDRYGTSVSASRLVSGERPPHRELERALADAYGADACVCFVSGHATNVSTIGGLFGPRDLVIHDTLIHNSVQQGAELAGARRMAFPHNDWAALDAMLGRERGRFERVLIVVEGIYSMDGDIPDLPRFIEVKQRHRALLMVDEAHSFGVLGRRGLGIREHFGLEGDALDLWMGTLSKSLAGCGGFIAGSQALIDNLRFASPGFVFSVGMSPPLAAASKAALDCMLAEPWRVAALHARGREFLRLAREAGIDTGTSEGYSIVPAITGSSVRAGRLSQALFERGLNVQPILYPAVPENSARLRFFLSAAHTEEQIRGAVRALTAEIAAL